MRPRKGLTGAILASVCAATSATDMPPRISLGLEGNGHARDNRMLTSGGSTLTQLIAIGEHGPTPPLSAVLTLDSFCRQVRHVRREDVHRCIVPGAGCHGV